MTQPPTHITRELDRRTSDGIDVRLLWCQNDDQVTMAVTDTKTGETFEVPIREGERALEVFRHPLRVRGTATASVCPDRGLPFVIETNATHQHQTSAPGGPMSSTSANTNRWPADPDLGDHMGEEKQMTGSNAEQTISEEKYVSATTFRRTGVAVATATWIVPLDGSRVGLLTSSASGKAKRLRNNPSVTLQPSDVRGRVKAGTTPVTGTVELVTSGPDFEAITSRVKAKYGLMVPITRLADRVRHLGKGPFPYADTGVVITLQD